MSPPIKFLCLLWNDPSALATTNIKALAQDTYILATMKRTVTRQVAFPYWTRTKPSYQIISLDEPWVQEREDNSRSTCKWQESSVRDWLLAMNQGPNLVAVESHLINHGSHLHWNTEPSMTMHTAFGPRWDNMRRTWNDNKQKHF